MTIDGDDGTRRPRPAAPVAQSPSAPETVTQRSFQTFKRIVDDQRELGAQVGAKVTEEYRRGTLTEQGLLESQALTCFAPDSVVAQLNDAAKQAMVDREAQARERYENMIASMIKPGDAAQEQRNSRYLARVERELDQADSPGKKVAVAEELIQKADPAQRGLLIEELPSLFTGDTSWIEATIQKVDPELASAATEVKHASQCTAMATWAHQQVQHGLKTGRPPQKLDVLAPAIARLDPDR